MRLGQWAPAALRDQWAPAAPQDPVPRRFHHHPLDQLHRLDPEAPQDQYLQRDRLDPEDQLPCYPPRLLQLAPVVQ